MAANRVYDHGGRVVVENGYVILDGPGPVAVTLTAEAAEQVGRKLRAAAAAAMLERRDPRTPDAETSN